MSHTAKQQFPESLSCIECQTEYPLSSVLYYCECGGLLEITRPSSWHQNLSTEHFDLRLKSRAALDRSGVWRFREAVLNLSEHNYTTHLEGSTRLYRLEALSRHAGIDQLAFKHEGENPTGSFKDRGMTVAVSQAKKLGKRWLACASTGNTSASLAAYAAISGMKAIVFIPQGQVAQGKLAQAVGYGATCVMIKGDFDAAMRLVREAAAELDLYLVNSINPFRLEGQKTIIWELLQDCNWQPPDWIIVPAGNLGNTSAFGKALKEAKAAGWIHKVPRLAAIQAEGANPFYLSYAEGFKQKYTCKAETIATAIKIGDPVNYTKAKKVMETTNGIVAAVSDTEILAAKNLMEQSGLGCEPASAATFAGLKKLVSRGVIPKNASVVCVLTGHMLKDPDAIITAAQKTNSSSKIIEVSPNLREVQNALQDIAKKGS